MERATSFGTKAELYDVARPAYPLAAVDRVVALAGHESPQVLEIGCGTGILTRQLIDRGCSGVAIDPDPSMLKIAERRSEGSGFEFACTPFERWLPTRAFDLVVAGQSWHWVDDSVGVPLAFDALEPGGHLALMWNRPATEGFEFRDELDEIYRQVAPELTGGSSQAFTTPLVDRLGEYEVPEPFGEVEQRSFEWTQQRSKAQYLDLLRTHSDHIQLDLPTRVALLGAVGDLIERRGGKIETRYRTLVITARRPR